MPAARIVAGTKSPETPSIYTDAQWRALPNLFVKDRELLYNAARAEFVNKVLLPDGTVSEDLAPLRAATSQADQDDLARLTKFTSARQEDILRGKLTTAEQLELRDLQYWANHSQAEELESHLAQQRFLLVVDANNVVHIWFQCAVDHNPDVHTPDGVSLAAATGASFPTREG